MIDTEVDPDNSCLNITTVNSPSMENMPPFSNMMVNTQTPGRDRDKPSTLVPRQPIPFFSEENQLRKDKRIDEYYQFVKYSQNKMQKFIAEEKERIAKRVKGNQKNLLGKSFQAR